MGKGLYDPEYTLDPEEEKERGRRSRANAKCTPDLLLAFIEKLGRMPTLNECKQEFGGVLGPMLDGWTLKDQGLLPGVKTAVETNTLDF